MFKSILICPDSVPNFLGMFDTTIAPTLLYYAYIPIVIIILLFSLYIAIKDDNSKRSKYLLILALSFSILLLNEVVQWIAVSSNIVYFSWQISAFLQFFVTLSVLCFSYNFLLGSVPTKLKIFGFFLSLPILVLLPTNLNITTFYLSSCQPGFSYYLWGYLYFLEIISVLGAIIIGYKAYKKKSTTGKFSNEIKQVLCVTIATVILLLIFTITNIAGDATLVYEINLFGPIGMVLFVSFISYIIVKFKAFNIKLLGAQALVWSLVIIIGAEFFFIQSDVNKILTAITLVISAWLGLIIVRSVKREVAAKEALAIANEKLKELDKLKSEFVSLATHQIRAPLSAIKGYLSEVFEGDFGPVSKEIEKPLQVVFQSTENLVQIVGDFLNISRIESGSMKYELAPVNLKQVVEETVKDVKPNLDRADLELQMDIPEGNYNVYADIGKVKQVIGNLIDNSMKYTPKGSIKISLTSNEQTQKVLFAINDTGIGISAEVLPKLFQKFTRAKGANEVNIIGTGLGLYVAKLMIEGQAGRIWAESPGAGKGSTFYMELPIAHVS